jgi:hypothetical protein
MENGKTTIEEVTDPEEVASVRASIEAAQRNSRWLQSHWADVLPQAVGKFLAVAGQEAFISDSARGARAMAEAAHPEDDGIVVQYVRPSRGPRVYGNRR